MKNAVWASHGQCCHWTWLIVVLLCWMPPPGWLFCLIASGGAAVGCRTSNTGDPPRWWIIASFVFFSFDVASCYCY